MDVSMKAPTIAFEHETLSDPTLYIRLLEVLNGTVGEVVTCRLTDWLKESAPTYYAL